MRDVLAHLVRGAEMTYASLTLDVLRGGFRPDRRCATRRLVRGFARPALISGVAA